MIRHGFVTNSSSTSYVFFLPHNLHINPGFMIEIGFPTLRDYESGGTFSLEQICAFIQGRMVPLDRKAFREYYDRLKEWLRDALDKEPRDLMWAMEAIFPTAQVVDKFADSSLKLLSFTAYSDGDHTIERIMDGSVGTCKSKFAPMGMIAISEH